MLGNWSLGDYWKRDAISWSYEFLNKELLLDSKRLWVTCFAGDSDAPRDTESASIWKSLGISDGRIFFYGKKDNWWGPAGETGPCGPDTEMFYDTTGFAHGKDCKPGDDCGRFFEIWNDVFMEYEKTKEGKFEPLKQKNVDTGMGVDRTTAVLSGLDDDYKVEDLWGNILSSIEEETKTKYKGNEKAHRIIADHVRAATFVISDGVIPSNKERGYVLRRLIRRATRYGRMLGKNEKFLTKIADATIETYKNTYPELSEKSDYIRQVLTEEEEKFLSTVSKGLRELEKLGELDGKKAFFLYESYGFPLELTEEIAKERGQKIDQKVFEKQFEKHRKLSRTASSGMFKGGLADHSEEVKKLHTVTHLLHTSLRKLLGEIVTQKGSNITVERLRFDFSYPKKLTDEELRKVESIINEQIKKDLPVSYEEKSLDFALKE
ncbi:alanine--tRNA ligase, partial [Candidatus Woesebacteria bacterium RBG_16_39_8b]